MASNSSCGLPRLADLRDLGDKPNHHLLPLPRENLVRPSLFIDPFNQADSRNGHGFIMIMERIEHFATIACKLETGKY